MRELVAMVGVGVAVLAVGAIGCGNSTSTGGSTLCNVVVPDGGNGGEDAGLACDLAWSCSDDSVHYELQCTLTDMGNFTCLCLTESVAGTTFTVNHFACTAADAAPAATTNCGWTLM